MMPIEHKSSINMKFFIAICWIIHYVCINFVSCYFWTNLDVEWGQNGRFHMVTSNFRFLLPLQIKDISTRFIKENIIHRAIICSRGIGLGVTILWVLKFLGARSVHVLKHLEEPYLMRVKVYGSVTPWSSSSSISK